MAHPIRLADIADAPACAAIVNDWIDRTAWIARKHSRIAIEQMITEGIPIREFWVAGDPIAGYLSFNTEASQIMGLYTAQPGNGVGKALMDQVKHGRDWLQLWSHAANHSAHRFYHREGFVQIGDRETGVDGIAEIQMEWRAKT